MTLHQPFFISSRLLPALKVADLTLQLERIVPEANGRHRASMILDFGDGSFCTDSSLQSGVGGFRGGVEVFETFLAFMEACGESMPDGENADLFPPHVAQWCEENQDEIACCRYGLCEEDGSGRVLDHLIEW